MPARRSGTNVSITTHSGPNVPILVITGQERVRVCHFFSTARVLETVCRTRGAPTYVALMLTEWQASNRKRLLWIRCRHSRPFGAQTGGCQLATFCSLLRKLEGRSDG